MIRRLRAVSALAVAAALTLAGCTTVPDSSTPQIVQPVEVESQVPPPGPLPGSDPRTIVQGFLNANGANDPNHSAARQYLAKPAKGWSDLKVTLVDHAQVGNVVFGKQAAGGGRTGTITVTGDEIGTIDDTGTYTPFLTGNGSGFGGESLPQTYRVAQVDHEWRITSLPPDCLSAPRSSWRSINTRSTSSTRVGRTSSRRRGTRSCPIRTPSSSGSSKINSRVSHRRN